MTHSLREDQSGQESALRLTASEAIFLRQVVAAKSGHMRTDALNPTQKRLATILRARGLIEDRSGFAFQVAATGQGREALLAYTGQERLML